MARGRNAQVQQKYRQKCTRMSIGFGFSHVGLQHEGVMWGITSLNLIGESHLKNMQLRFNGKIPQHNPLMLNPNMRGSKSMSIYQ